MKMIKDKQLLVGADFAGFPLKEAVVAYLRSKGWEITDVGVRSLKDNDPDLMFHRVGLRVGALIAEREFERALIFCGTGRGSTLRPANARMSMPVSWNPFRLLYGR